MCARTCTSQETPLVLFLGAGHLFVSGNMFRQVCLYCPTSEITNTQLYACLFFFSNVSSWGWNYNLEDTHTPKQNTTLYWGSLSSSLLLPSPPISSSSFQPSLSLSFSLYALPPSVSLPVSSAILRFESRVLSMFTNHSTMELSPQLYIFFLFSPSLSFQFHSVFIYFILKTH